jgi:UDP-N-acetylmuramoylalanine--D-glutamate ligase
MNIALAGFSTEGRASYDYFISRGDQVTICDQNVSLAIPDDADAQVGPHYLDNLSGFDLIVRSPGLHPDKILESNPRVKHKITSGTNEFLKACPTKNIIGVTGTKGKGTTSSLISESLKAAGKTVHLGGNIGVPALSMLPGIKSDDWVVLELSSFQLIDLQQSPPIGVCVMVVSEHLDWHKDFEEYIQAKQNLFKHLFCRKRKLSENSCEIQRQENTLLCFARCVRRRWLYKDR